MGWVGHLGCVLISEVAGGVAAAGESASVATSSEHQAGSVTEVVCPFCVASAVTQLGELA